jgi:hypothetical protein
VRQSEMHWTRKASVEKVGDNLDEQWARCSIYQGQYNGQETGSVSNHLLKFAVIVKFLHSPMDDSEFLQAIRRYLHPFVQRCWITGPIKQYKMLSHF